MLNPSYVVVAWTVLVVAAFPSFPPRRGLLVILFSGVLFLPQVGAGMIEIGPIKFSNLNAISYALLLAPLLFDAGRLTAFIPRAADLPALAWCLCPLASTLLNDPPPDGSGVIRDAISHTISHLTLYFVPYLIGRTYFADSAGLRELADGVMVAGLVYVPFCLYEVRMSPHLHAALYGYYQMGFITSIRFGGYRPMVFMQSGLAVGMLLAVATVLAAWVRRTDSAAGRWRDAAVWVLGPMMVLCKSSGAIALGAVGLGLLWFTRAASARWGLLLLVAAPPAYCVTRTAGLWNGTELVNMASNYVDQDRADSLTFRLNQENALIGRALERPGFGWGGWGRNRVRDSDGRDISTTDGLWIIYLGVYGVVGLTAFGAVMLLPVWRYARRVPPAWWASPPYAAATGCAVTVGLWCVDCLFNAMPNPLFLIMAGGLTGLTATPGGPPRPTAERPVAATGPVFWRPGDPAADTRAG